LNRAQRLGAALCVVMLDIDGFKQFNDSFGHAPGDALLREFANVLRKHLRKSDISCRYGGDEFVLVMPDSSIADTEQRVEQIRVFLKELQLAQQPGNELGAISLSAGIAAMPEHGSTDIELLRAADEAMYTAKQAGGDRSVIHVPARNPSLLSLPHSEGGLSTTD
jgi:diguanylate cyclase (GGDEF)-like protein